MQLEPAQAACDNYGSRTDEGTYWVCFGSPFSHRLIHHPQGGGLKRSAGIEICRKKKKNEVVLKASWFHHGNV